MMLPLLRHPRSPWRASTPPDYTEKLDGLPSLPISYSMSNSSEAHRLANSIAGLVASITEIINAKVAASTDVLVQVRPPVPTSVAPYDPILTKRQLAAHMQVSLRTVQNWMEKGSLPYYKIGKTVRFRLSDVKRNWDAKHKKHSY
jgi:excisionase family DNA binding protein